MARSYSRCFSILLALPLACGGLLTSFAYAEPDSATALQKESFEKSMARAKQTGRPLVVFGLSDTCHRCQAVKNGIASTHDFKLLLTQYVATEIPFGGKEFAKLFGDVVRKDKSIPTAIGAPAVFIFTSKGNTVYAGPNRESGIALDDEFKKLLISGIEKNGGLRAASSSGEQALSADVAKARRLIGQNQIPAAAALVGQHLSPEEDGSDDQLAALVELTGLQPGKSKAHDQLEAVAEQLADKAPSLIQAAIETGKTKKPTVGAVRLAELDRAFADFASLASAFDDAWKQIEATHKIPQLREQAQLIDQARTAERSPDPSSAIALYAQVVSTYPNTEAAQLSKLRISQLQARKHDTAKSSKRP